MPSDTNDPTLHSQTPHARVGQPCFAALRIRPMLCLVTVLTLAAGSLPTTAAGTAETRRAGLATNLAPAQGFERFGDTGRVRSFHFPISFLETVLSYEPSDDPRLVFLLANAYIVASQQIEGMAFIELSLDRYSGQMSTQTRSTYLAALALLRATHADNVTLLKRIGWVRDTFRLLEEAEALAEGSNPLVKWSAGLIYAQVPRVFGKRDAAIEALTWLVEHPTREPTPGFYREAYRYLGELHAGSGNMAAAQKFKRLSGYEEAAPAVPFMGWFATSFDSGLLFAPTPWMEEVIPSRVYALRGFGFSDFHFIVSRDEQHLIAIDAGTQPFSTEAAMTYLSQLHPKLPPLTHVLVTHAHWDHIGGHSHFRSLTPRPTFIGHRNYRHTIDKNVSRTPRYQQFRSARWENAWVEDYQPDLAIDAPTDLVIGGSPVRLVPVTGGETEDALLIHFPDLSTVFMGDALMPFFGEPWEEEGSVEGALDAIDSVLAMQPDRLLHGHYGITIIYDAHQLPAFREALAWLARETRRHINAGYSAADVIRLSLIPPSLEKHPEIFLGYLAAYESAIARITDSMTGIWQEDASAQSPVGLDVVGTIEYGRMLTDYLDMSPRQITQGIRRMLEGGDNALALKMAVAAMAAGPENPDYRRLRNEAADRLRSAEQFFNPFKFATYTELRDTEHPALPTPVEGELRSISADLSN